MYESDDVMYVTSGNDVFTTDGPTFSKSSARRVLLQQPFDPFGGVALCSLSGPERTQVRSSDDVARKDLTS